MKIEISIEELEKLLKKAPVEKTDADEKILQAVNQFLRKGGKKNMNFSKIYQILMELLAEQYECLIEVNIQRKEIVK